MRVSISCEACRQSKVKCIHNGQAPCHRCNRLNRSHCELTDPRSASLTPRKSVKRGRAVQASPSLSQNSSQTAATRSTGNGNQNVCHHCESPNAIATLPAATIIHACDTYRRKFPVVNFLHYPSLIAEISADSSAVDPIFVASLLSLCARFIPGLASEEVYADYARKQLARRAFEAPSLSMAQSLVMISLYEWGSGRPYKAWMYSGMATYMIQSLLKTADDSMEHNPDEFYASQAQQTQYEQLVRTYWAQFAQDCELSSGARQHFALSFDVIKVPLPISDRDFNFSIHSPTRWMPKDLNRQSLTAPLTIDHGLTIVTRGFDIFVRILRYANESRRGRESESPPHRAFQSLLAELDEWRALQDVTVRFPDTHALAHVALGYGELFAYINLVYFMSVLFLHRDRVLAGIAWSTFEGDDAFNKLFTASQSIGSILSELESSETPVITPYAGFSVFVAAHINMYGTVSPHPYPGGRERAEAEKKSNFAYLERVCKFWPGVGRSWWRTVQEANRFYENARNHPGHVMAVARPGHLALAGTLDEYGDIRSARRHEIPSMRRRRGETVLDEGGMGRHSTGQVPDVRPMAELHEWEAELLQWPFIDETWTSGFDTGVEAAWPNLG